MKKVITIICLLFSVGAFSQTVPAEIQQKFKDEHPMHDYLTWTVENGNYKSSSKDPDGLRHTIVYDKDAQVIRTERELSVQNIPSAVSGYLEGKYPGDKNFTVWEVVDREQNKTYFSSYNDEVITFDKEGRLNKSASPGVISR